MRIKHVYNQETREKERIQIFCTESRAQQRDSQYPDAHIPEGGRKKTL